jgi:tRNA(fMet)-specific endonuclease VapC
MRVLVDTSAYSAFMRGHPELKLALQGAEEIYLSPIVLGELQSGFRRGKHRARNEKGLDQFLGAPRVELIPILDSTAVRYAEILTYLRGAGNPIPTNDVWIAASAMEHGLRVLTTDKHFEEVPQILVDCWEPWS